MRAPYRGQMGKLRIAQEEMGYNERQWDGARVAGERLSLGTDLQA